METGDNKNRNSNEAEIFEEAATKLQKRFEAETGTSFKYGSFRFIFHEGRFQGIEDWPRNRSYMSPKRSLKK